MTNLMRERRFEIIGARRSIRREKFFRIQCNISFDDRTAGIVKDARATG